MVDSNNKRESIMTQDKTKAYWLSVFVFAISILVLGTSTVQARDLPETYITEEITSSWLPNGTLLREDGEGSVKVLTEDIIQEVVLELDGKDKTNLDSTEAYKPSVASPDMQSTEIYVNTTDSDTDLKYKLNLEDFDEVPRINLTADYRNIDGGKDLHSSNNTFQFNVTLTSSTRMDGSELIFRAPRKTGPDEEDSFDFHDVTCTEGSCETSDVTGSGFDEVVRWKGDLEPGESVNVSFFGDTELGTNFHETSPAIDMGQGSYRAFHRQDDTHTGIAFWTRHGKGNVRTGLHLSDVRDGKWVVQGFMKNRADTLNFTVDSWGIYRTEDDEPLLNQTYPDSKKLKPSESIHTERYETHKADEEKYYVLFDWEIEWGDYSYKGDTESALTMPELHMVKSDIEDVDLTLLENNEDERRVKARKDVVNMADEEINITEARLKSWIPNSSYEKNPVRWSIDEEDVSLKYDDGETQLEVVEGVNISVQDSRSGGDGFVILDLNITESNIEDFGTGDELVMEYITESGSESEDRVYNFSWESALVSESGTPDVQRETENITISGVDEPDPSAPPRIPERIDIERLESRASVITGNRVNVVRSDRVIDTGDRGLREVGFEFLLPEGTEMELPSLEITHKNEEWKEIKPENYVIEDHGNSTVGGDVYRLYEVEIEDEGDHGLVLEDGDIINVTYDTVLDFGKNEIVTRLSGYDYYRDRFIKDDAKTSVRVGWELEDLEVDKGSWKQRKAVVEESVGWERPITVNNPNDRPITKTITVGLPRQAFSPSLDGQRLDIRGRKGAEFVSIDLEVAPLQRKVMELVSYTPAVVVKEEEMEILESNETQVKFLSESLIKNPSPHRYREVHSLVDIGRQQIEWAEVDGEDMDYFEKNDKTMVGPMIFHSDQEKSLRLAYTELPPVLVLSTDAFNYTDPSEINVSILAVTGQGYDGGIIELLVYGPEPGGRNVHSELITVTGGSLETERNLDLSGMPTGNYTIEATLRRGFKDIASDKTNIWIQGERAILMLESWYILAILIILVILIVPRLYRRKDLYQRRMEEVRKKMKEKF